MKSNRRGWIKRALGLGAAAAMTRLMPERALAFETPKEDEKQEFVENHSYRDAPYQVVGFSYLVRNYGGSWTFNTDHLSK